MNQKQKEFCEYYAEYGNATQAYLKAYPNSKYNTARGRGNKMLKNENIKEYIIQIKEEAAILFKQTKEKTIKELIISAEQAKEKQQFNAYATLRNMIIKIMGFYEPEKSEINHKGITINYNKPKKD